MFCGLREIFSKSLQNLIRGWIIENAWKIPYALDLLPLQLRCMPPGDINCIWNANKIIVAGASAFAYFAALGQYKLHTPFSGTRSNEKPRVPLSIFSNLRSRIKTICYCKFTFRINGICTPMDGCRNTVDSSICDCGDFTWLVVGLAIRISGYTIILWRSQQCVPLTDIIQSIIAC